MTNTDLFRAACHLALVNVKHAALIAIDMLDDRYAIVTILWNETELEISVRL